MKRNLIWAGSLILLLVGLAYSQNTLIKRLIASQDIAWATGGSGEVETFTYTTPEGRVITLNKPDATNLKYRSIAKSVEGSATGDTVPASTSYASLSAAVTEAGSTGTLKLVPGTYLISSNLTINSTIKIEKGAKFSIANGVTLTINGPIIAGPWQIFSWTGTGAVSLASNNALKEIFAEWWGAVANDSIDCTAALTAALATAKPLHLLTGTYRFAPGLVPQAAIYGDGPQSVLRCTATTGAGLLPYNYVTLSNFTLKGPGNASYTAGCNGVQALYYNGNWVNPGSVANRDNDPAHWRGYGLVMDKVTIKEWPANGICPGAYSSINNCIVTDCFNEGLLIQGDYCKITNNTIKNVNSWGIDLNCSRSTVQANIIYNCGNNANLGSQDCGGIVMSSHTQSGGMSGNKIIDNLIDTSTNAGITILAPSGSNYTLTDCEVRGNTVVNVNTSTTDSGAGAINVVDNSTSGSKVQNILVSNNIIKTTTVGHGISLIDGNWISINNNKIYSPNDKGIVVLTVAHVPGYIDIISNTLYGYNTIGILLASATNFKCIGNTLIRTSATAGKAIHIDSASGHGVVSDNLISYCLYGIYYSSSGDYVSITGNNLTDNVGTPLYRGGTKTAVIQKNNLGVPVPVYTNNAAAAAALPVGEFYRTGSDPDQLCVVH